MAASKLRYTVSGVSRKGRSVVTRHVTYTNAKRALSNLREGSLALDGTLVETKAPPKQPFRF